ncbi:MAG: hypothetical protein HFE86_06770 [Clostridiales bacterium]|nr:hypothetical protein [Clostridiales bacterium]
MYKKDLLKNAFAHIEPSADFVSRTLDKLEAETEYGRIRRPWRLKSSCTLILCLGVLLVLPLAAVVPSLSGQRLPLSPAGYATELDGCPVPYESLRLPPDDGQDFSEEALASNYTLTDFALGNYTSGLSHAALAVKGTVTAIRFNDYAYDSIDAGLPASHYKHRLRHQERSVVYEVRVEKIFGARPEEAAVQPGDLLIAENRLLNMAAASLTDPAGRIQAGHQYILTVGKGCRHLISGWPSAYTFEGDYVAESPYFLTNSHTPPIQLTQDGGYLFFARTDAVRPAGWLDLLTDNTVRVVMPAETDPLYKEHMYLRAGPAFEDDFQRLVDQNFATQTK